MCHVETGEWYVLRKFGFIGVDTRSRGSVKCHDFINRVLLIEKSFARSEVAGNEQALVNSKGCEIWRQQSRGVRAEHENIGTPK